MVLRFYVIEPNDSISINFIIKSRDAIFDENRFSSVPRPSLMIPNGTEDIGGSVLPKEVTEEVVQQHEPELRKRTRDEVAEQHSYCFNVEDDPKIFDEAMKSQDKKLKVDGTIEKFKARLVIHGFKQKSGIDYFDTYAPMDVKTACLNGDLDKEAPKQWHQKFDEVVLSNSFLLNQADKYVYSKFDESGKGVCYPKY
ncbi:zinc finger, CCHC-type containing protein [Tanacetum coccineum]